MWGDDSAYGEGGFNHNTNGQDGGSATKESQQRAKVIAPVTVKQILDSGETGIRIKSVDVNVVQVLGIVRAIETSSIKVTYRVEDPTGSVVGVTYLDADSEGATPVIENTYCILTGSIRTQSGAKFILIFNIAPVTSFNQIQDHYLRVMYLPLKAELLDNEVEVKAEKLDMMSNYGGLSSGHAESSHVFDNLRLDPLQKKVLTIVAGCSSESGMNVNDINVALPVKTSMDKIKSALDHLMNEGHIFTTIDDFHYKATESM